MKRLKFFGEDMASLESGLVGCRDGPAIVASGNGVGNEMKDRSAGPGDSSAVVERFEEPVGDGVRQFDANLGS